MTASPHPRRQLTVAEYLALPEDTDHHWELQEGHLVMSPRPAQAHAYALARLIVQLDGQLPTDVCALPEVDVDLRLAPPDRPGWVRAPDLVVVPEQARNRIRRDGGIFQAGDILLAVEIVSPRSRRTDYVTKRDEYADAGIPHYWIIDLDPPVSLLAHHLAGEFGYAADAERTGKAQLTEPFPLVLDLDDLGR